MNDCGRRVLFGGGLLLLAASCGRRAPAVREKTFLATDEPAKVSDLTHPCIVANSQGVLIATLFMHARFPTATEPHEAIAVLASADGGATWQRVGSLSSFVTYGVWGSDLAIDEDDRLYLCWVASVFDRDTRVPAKTILLSRSEDGGRTWTDPGRVNAAAGGQRRSPTIAAAGGRVYAAWLDGRRGGSPASEDVYFAASPDRGATWADDVCLETDLDRKEVGSGEPSLCVGADGTVRCVYVSRRKQPKPKSLKNLGGYCLATSTDGGTTFSSQMYHVGMLSDACLAAEAGRLHLAATRLRIDLAESLDPEHEICFSTSPDGGAEWSDFVRITEGRPRTDCRSLTVLPVGEGRLIACWRQDPLGVYAAASLDGGKSWGKNLKVAESSRVGLTPFDVAADPAGGAFFFLVSDVRKGGGDATHLVAGRLAP